MMREWRTSEWVDALGISVVCVEWWKVKGSDVEWKVSDVR
jgi:hypothetical protein